MSKALCRSKLINDSAVTDGLSKNTDVVYWMCRKQAVVEQSCIKLNRSFLVCGTIISCNWLR